MSEKRPTPTPMQLYTSEASASAKQAEVDKEVPDPTAEEGTKRILANMKSGTSYEKKPGGQ